MAVFPDKQTLPMGSAPSSAPRAYLSRTQNTTSVLSVFVPVLDQLTAIRHVMSLVCFRVALFQLFPNPI
jgi:hypothetical protein